MSITSNPKVYSCLSYLHDTSVHAGANFVDVDGFGVGAVVSFVGVVASFVAGISVASLASADNIVYGVVVGSMVAVVCGVAVVSVDAVGK